MATTALRPRRGRFWDARSAPVLTAERLREPAYQVYLVFRLGFTVLPVWMGIDKFFNLMVYWPKYLASWAAPNDPQAFMYFVGALEITAGLAVLLKPRYGSRLVAFWLAAIVINLLSYPGWYDIAVRDFGLMLAALGFARLAAVYDPPLPLLARVWQRTAPVRSRSA